jgi:hypothetical protein
LSAPKARSQIRTPKASALVGYLVHETEILLRADVAGDESSIVFARSYSW